MKDEEHMRADELRAWAAVLWIALADITRAYREFASSAAHGDHGGDSAPRKSDPVYTWATKVLGAVPTDLRDADSDAAKSVVQARIAATPVRPQTPG